MSRRLIELASEASKNCERRKAMNEHLTALEKIILDIPCNEDSEQSKSSHLELRTTNANEGEITLGGNSLGKLKDPAYTKPKGRMKTTVRQKGIVEQIISKQKITCSGCGKQGHNIAGCKQIQEEPVDRPKKKSRKNPEQLEKSKKKGKTNN